MSTDSPTPADTKRTCLNCGSHVSDDFSRVFCDAEGCLHACPECAPLAGIGDLAVGIDNSVHRRQDPPTDPGSNAEVTPDWAAYHDWTKTTTDNKKEPPGTETRPITTHDPDLENVDETEPEPEPDPEMTEPEPEPEPEPETETATDIDTSLDDNVPPTFEDPDPEPKSEIEVTNEDESDDRFPSLNRVLDEDLDPTDADCDEENDDPDPDPDPEDVTEDVTEDSDRVTCEICGGKFVGEKGLAIHKGHTHPEAVESDMDDGESDMDDDGEDCPVCGKTYLNERGVSIHMGRMHTEEEIDAADSDDAESDEELGDTHAEDGIRKPRVESVRESDDELDPPEWTLGDRDTEHAPYHETDPRPYHTSPTKLEPEPEPESELESESEETDTDTENVDEEAEPSTADTQSRAGRLIDRVTGLFR